ncbi:hypothetical protein GCM10010348_19360 [Streptomyces anthocyanicus]|nr:hypothetical protein GCM10010348_19360 [Streptomyces anthocyanicus]
MARTRRAGLLGRAARGPRTPGTGPANARPGYRPGGRGWSAAYGLEPTMVGMAPVLATVTA